MKIIIYIIIFITFLFSLQSCKTPSYNKVENFDNNKSYLPNVQYNLSKNFNVDKLKCIIVDKIKSTNNMEFPNLNKENIIRKAVYGVLSSKNFLDIELTKVDNVLKNNKNISNKDLLEKLDCDAILIGKINKFHNDFYLTYSVTSVELEFSLIDKNEKLLWKSKNSANSHEGTLPLSPISLITGIFTATSNVQDEVALQMIDTAVRRGLKTLPNRPSFPLENEIKITNYIFSKKIETISYNQNFQNLFLNGDYENLLINANSQIKLDPKNSKNYLYAGKASLFLGDYKSSIDYLLTAIAKGEQNEITYSILGVSYFKDQNLKLSNAAFLKGLNFNRNNSFLHYNLGIVNEINKNFVKASNHFYNSGINAIIEENYIRLYKSLKSLKRLELKNTTSKELYSKLGLKVNNLLKNKK